MRRLVRFMDGRFNIMQQGSELEPWIHEIAALYERAFNLELGVKTQMTFHYFSSPYSSLGTLSRWRSLGIILTALVINFSAISSSVTLVWNVTGDIWSLATPPTTWPGICLARGATYAQYMNLFFRDTTRFWLLESLPGLFNGKPGLANSDGEYVVYLEAGGTVSVDLTDVNGDIAARWYNPRTGIAPVLDGTTGHPHAWLQQQGGNKKNKSPSPKINAYIEQLACCFSPWSRQTLLNFAPLLEYFPVLGLLMMIYKNPAIFKKYIWYESWF